MQIGKEEIIHASKSHLQITHKSIDCFFSKAYPFDLLFDYNLVIRQTNQPTMVKTFTPLCCGVTITVTHDTYVVFDVI